MFLHFIKYIKITIARLLIMRKIIVVMIQQYYFDIPTYIFNELCIALVSFKAPEW